MKTKRLCAAALIIVMVLALPVWAQAEDDVYMLLRPGNFTLPAVVGTWLVQPNAMIYAGGIAGTFLQNSNASEPAATARIYIEAEGEYVLWGLSADSTGGQTNRHCLIGFDDTYDGTTFGSGVPGFSWTRSEPAALQAGWHTVCVKTGYPSMSLAAVMVTNDLDLILSRDTLYSDISVYEDTTAPVIDGDIETVYISQTAYDVNFPAAQDENGIFAYESYIDDAPVSSPCSMRDILPLQRMEIKLLVSDRYGNTTAIRREVMSSPFEIEHFAIQNSAGIDVDAPQDLTGSAVAKIIVRNRTSEDIQTMLGLSLYTKNYDRMIKAKISRIEVGALDSETISVTIDLPSDWAEDKYVLAANFWDASGRLEPYTVGIDMP